MMEVHTDVAIVGAGAAGLLLALELACRGVRCIVFDDGAAPILPCAADAPSVRSLAPIRRHAGHAGSVQPRSIEEDLRLALLRHPCAAVRPAGRLASIVASGGGGELEWLEADGRLTAHAGYVVGCGYQFEALRAVLRSDDGDAGVAQAVGRFRAGRCFAVGAAASLIDHGVGVRDALNLGWKLAAVIQGWGGAALLDTYETERRPLAQRLCSYARAIEYSQRELALPARPGRGPTGRERVRRQAEFGARFRAHVERASYIHQLQAEFRYDSSIVAREDDGPPGDCAALYPAAGAPGALAPRVSLEAGTLCDHFGRDFTLLWLGVESPAANWDSTAGALGIALEVLPCGARQARKLYGADLVLIRPDGHIAWRGDYTADAHAVLRLATLQ